MNAHRLHRSRAGCEGKQRHETYAEAASVAATMRRQARHHGRSARISAYACARCGGYHVGHTHRASRLLRYLRTLPRFDWRRALSTVEQDG